MEFFNKQVTRNYFDPISEKLKNEVSNMSDENILTCDFSEWIDYLYSKYEIVPITVFEEGITQSIEEIKVKKYNQFAQYSKYKPNYFEVDGYRIVYKIPYDGDSEELFLQPSTFIMIRYDVYAHTSPEKDDVGSFELSFEFTKQELENKGEEIQSFVKTQFENKFKNYREMIEYVNQEVVSFNSQISNFANKCLEERKEKASSFAMISQQLEIPLNKNENAPSVTPVPLKRTSRVPKTAPTKKPLPQEYAITDKNYEDINKIIYSCGTTMEKTARTYVRHNEEELRDHLLATLGTHYDNITSETFRKIGKTDINIEFENKAAFIGECKMWQGEKVFTQAIQQVLNYSTWRDVKVSVILFSKKNKSFPNVISQLNNWVILNTQPHMKVNENMWNCKYYRKDMGITISLTILVFDLYVDETQFKDSRK